MRKKSKLYIRMFIWLALAASVFVYSESYERYIAIEDYAEPFPLEIGRGQYYDITQEYPLAKLEGFEDILTTIAVRIKYEDICFRDEGSYIKEDAFKDNKIYVLISYEGRNETVVEFWYNNSVPQEKCFKIINKRKITWKWGFSIESKLAQLVFEQSDRRLILHPNTKTYLKVSNYYYPVSALISLFYSGIFLWAITRIYRYLKKGFED